MSNQQTEQKVSVRIDEMEKLQICYVSRLAGYRRIYARREPFLYRNTHRFI